LALELGLSLPDLRVDAVRPGGKVAVTDAVEHTHEWMRHEQADLWLGFSREQVDGYFRAGGLVECGYASLGIQ